VVDLEIKRLRLQGASRLRLLAMGLHGLEVRGERQIFILGIGEGRRLKVAVLFHEMIDSMRVQDGVDGKPDFSAQSGNLSKRFVLVFMEDPWCECPSWF